MFANALPALIMQVDKCILQVAEELANRSFEIVKALIDQYGIEYLKTFPLYWHATAIILQKILG